jgi:hypothetical protein
MTGERENMNNYIFLTGWVETLPKMKTIDEKLCCIFIFNTRAIVRSNIKYENFSIKVLVSKKYAKRCLLKNQEIIGKYLHIEGSLSCNEDGLYISAEKILMLNRLRKGE